MKSTILTVLFLAAGIAVGAQEQLTLQKCLEK